MTMHKRAYTGLYIVIAVLAVLPFVLSALLLFGCFFIVVGALGVVFGDIGTSPIYTLQTLFDPRIQRH